MAAILSTCSRLCRQFMPPICSRCCSASKLVSRSSQNTIGKTQYLLELVGETGDFFALGAGFAIHM